MSKIQYVRTGSIKPHPENPRIIDPEALEKLKKSVSDFPKMLEYRPILVDKKTKYILGGNQRHRVATELGLEEIPVIFLSVTDKKAREIMLKDNTQFGEWDFDKLKTFTDKDTLIGWGVEDAEYIDFNEQEDENEEEDINEEEPEDFSVIKKIVFNLKTEDYERALNDLVKFNTKHGLQDNTEAIAKLLENYERGKK